VIDVIPYSGRIICGDNPFLYARKVDTLNIEMDENGKENPTWKERPLPNMNGLKMNAK
jgi:hypothetical protein